MKNIGITVYGCEQDEADAFRALSPRFGVMPTIIYDPVSEANAIYANRCISVGHKTEVSASILLALKRAGVKYISTRSIGCNHIDTTAAKRLGIVVGNVAYSPDSVADYTMMLMLMAVRNAKSIMRSVEKHDFRLDSVRGKVLSDMTVGVVGTGRIGKAVIERLRGFGCHVLAYDRSQKIEANYVPFDTLLQNSDIVTLHVPLNADTRHIIGHEQIRRMKQGAFIINTGRGALVDTDALVKALENGKLGGAALDVLEGEEGLFYFDYTQKPIDNQFFLKLQRMPNVIITPHTAYYTEQALRDIVEKTIKNCLDFERAWRMNKVKVAILFGGCSEEHDVSVKSAIEIAANIDNEKYEPIYIGITKSGVWKMCEKPCAEWENGNCCSAVLSPDKKMHGLLVLKNNEYEIHHVDVAFSVLHGKTGEDGSIQGLFELSGIPYVGCDIQSSAICMDKSLAYIIAKNAGIATPEFWVINKDDRPAADAFTYPVFVKPARSGSSYGVTKVNGADELDAAIDLARQYDSKIIIEQAVLGCEVGCAVLGNSSELIVGEVDQIRLRHGFFRIHQEAEPEKGSENAVINVPADLSAEERGRIQETAKKIYKALGCRGLARVDMFLQDNGRIVLNEVNTLPGFTSYSRYPRMMAAAGITLPELIDRLIVLALKG